MMTINNLTAPRKSLGLYIHVPYCIRKCNYCDFLSFGGYQIDDYQEYFQSLFHEIRLNASGYSNKYYVDSIFIGGGTPSITESSLMRQLMKTVYDCFEVVRDSEITIESNPKTLDAEKLEAYLESGINRISIGAQSFNDELLNNLGRTHNTEDFLANYTLARESGFRNINLDLMFGIPGQTMPIWIGTLERAISLAPEHISFYSLQIEEGTIFESMYRDGSLNQAEEELDRDMYHSGVKLLKDNGYRHYEISNAAREGYQCRHNLKYWSMADYLGFGLGAHSFLEGVRFSNVTDLKEYMNIGRNLVSEDHRQISEQEVSPYISWQHRNTKKESISEYLFTGLRKMQGIELSDFEQRFGNRLEGLYGDVLKKHLTAGLIEEEDSYLRFTEKGIDISNRVLADFI